MRAWIIFGIGAAIGIVIGISIGEAYGLPNLAGKLVTIACMTLGGCLTLGIGAMAGWVSWIRSDIV